MNRRCSSLVLAASLLLPWGAQAQSDFPSRPVKVIITGAPGSASDTLVRFLSERAGKFLGQPVIPENRPGAQTLIATRAVARAPADGYTLLLGSNTSHSANPYLVKDLGYDPVKDFTPITMLTINPLMLVVNTEMPVRSVSEFVAYARQRPGKLNYGIGNSGGLVAAQMIKTLAGIDALGVNYQSTAPAASDLVAGRLDFMVTDPSVIGPFAQAGKLRILGITTRQRLATYPDVAPLAETGLPGYEYASWAGLFAPAGVPADVAKKLNQAFGKVLADPETMKFLNTMGMIPTSQSPEQFQAFVQEQFRLWGRLTREAGLTPQ